MTFWPSPGQHWKTDLLDRVRSIVPGLVHEVCIRAHGVHLDAHFAQLFVFVRQVAELGWTYKRKVRRIKEEDCPLALHVCLRDRLEAGIVVGLGFEKPYKYNR
jgi:hypothetical protein